MATTSEDPWILIRQLLHRFQQVGDLADLRQAIAVLEALVRSTEVWDDRARQTSLLRVALSYQIDHLAELSDLEETISKHRGAINLTPNGHPDKPIGLIILGNSFRARFGRLGDLSDLGEAIPMYRDAVDLARHDHPDKPDHFTNLGNFFSTRFDLLGELSDLEGAISSHKNAVDLTPHGHPDKPGRLNTLGISF
ncbi:hypothetical protein HD554DRAFT_607121 [Boletus coccyginus]|nr:hypothetical protein HD554DRAFT_607121 [Boletus coccyginus]